MKSSTMLDQLLEYSCEELQLSATNHAAAETHYHAVGEWLAAKGSQLYAVAPVIYPQGSFRIGTTIHPIGTNEHDLDFVCEMNVDWKRTLALDVLDAFEARLRAHGTYAPMVERLKRCIRLNYGGAFHMDILPAAPETVRYGTEVRVPDRKLEAWKPSNPKGYAAWFENQGRLVTDALTKKADIAPMPALQAAVDKTPLQRAVQLIKRARDRYFAGRPDDAPRSIVITTLAAQAYAKQSSTAQALHDILSSMVALADRAPMGLEVRNPANSQEVLSELWVGNTAAYGAFRTWLRWFAVQWDKVLAADSLPAAERELEALFGEDVVNEALRKHATDMATLRKSGGLNVTRAGALTGAASISSVRPNTFFGK
jgi:Second Messenger Oligonucleotide or Dinucleotide Synthetase domain